MLSTSGLVHEAEAGRRRGAGAGPRMNSLLRPVRAGQPGPRPPNFRLELGPHQFAAMPSEPGGRAPTRASQPGPAVVASDLTV